MNQRTRAALSGDGSLGAASWSLVVVTVVAFVVRAAAYVRPSQLLAPRELDDATMYSAAVDVLHGQTLYGDVLYLHPPGLVTALLPFAWLGEHVGDALALAVARALTVLVGTLSTFLVAWLLRRRGTVAVLAGAGLYAVWVPVVYSERVVFLEPALTLCLLLALVVLRLDRPTGAARGWLRPTTTAPLVAGALTGVAASFKVWAFVTAAALLVVVLVWRGGRAAGWFALGGLVVVAAFVVSFAVRAPGDLWRDVVGVQAGRPSTTTSFGLRLREFAPVSSVPAAWWTTALAVLVLVLVVVALALTLARGVVAWRRDRSGLPETAAWALLALVQGATVLAAPSFFLHYAAFPAPAIALLAGAGAATAAAWLRAWAGTSPDRGRAVVLRTVAVVAVLALAGAAIAGATARLRWTGSRAELVTWAAQQDCVWGLASGVVAAGAATRNAENDCPVPADVWGEGLAALDDSGDGAGEGGAVEERDAFVAEMQRELAQVDAVVVPIVTDGTWLHGAAEAYLSRNFDHVGTAGGFEMWERT
ncbi:hypothetical protein [Luteimicrobium subarcticum]|uniref:Dolichyl-phosphate-mannose-protein mannosyltransferase n=1 Tax=Luteimicrobium subarcticum TaxID=620910 RepID=A0A2M8WT59_9MICO|nr:hypothetical protein [Luteimicrobium subarcticum]PJI94131.1 hypothetical protein CLV34_1617 [Luteimicrobium subarcticum]